MGRYDCKRLLCLVEYPQSKARLNSFVWITIQILCLQPLTFCKIVCYIFSQLFCVWNLSLIFKEPLRIDIMKWKRCPLPVHSFLQYQREISNTWMNLGHKNVPLLHLCRGSTTRHYTWSSAQHFTTIENMCKYTGHRCSKVAHWMV